MEIKDLLNELIEVSTNLFNDKGQPENFDLEYFIQQLEDYHQELDDIGQFYYQEDNDYYDEAYDDEN
jgi:pantothenate kinase